MRWLPRIYVVGWHGHFSNDDDAPGTCLCIEWGHTLIEIVFARRDRRWR